MKLKSFALALGMATFLVGAVAATPVDNGGVAEGASAAPALTAPDTPAPLTPAAPLLCTAVRNPDPEQGPGYIVVHCSGNCGTTNASWTCLNESCCTDCTTNPLSPRFGCLSAAGVCR